MSDRTLFRLTGLCGPASVVFSLGRFPLHLRGDASVAGASPGAS